MHLSRLSEDQAIVWGCDTIVENWKGPEMTTFLAPVQKKGTVIRIERDREDVAKTLFTCYIEHSVSKFSKHRGKMISRREPDT